MHDWLIDDGILIRLIEDVDRNRFYDKVLHEIVSGKNCIDVGFGTGFLSLLALKHGAKSVVAYEKNIERYEFGCQLIETLGLKNKIKLEYGSFLKEKIDSRSDLIIHEIIGAVLYNEGLYCTFNTKIPVCPERYTTDFVMMEIDKNQADPFKWTKKPKNFTDLTRLQKEFVFQQISMTDFRRWYDEHRTAGWPIVRSQVDIANTSIGFQQKLYSIFIDSIDTDVERKFDPGVEIDESWKKFIQHNINADFKIKLASKIIAMSPKIVNDFDEEKISLFASLDAGKNKILCSITLDHSQRCCIIRYPDKDPMFLHDFPQEFVDVTIDNGILKGKTMIIMPACSFGHNQHTMKIEDGHWNIRVNWMSSAVLDSVDHDVIIRQNFTNGNILYFQP